MSLLGLTAVWILGIAVVLACVRLALGPTPADRLVAADTLTVSTMPGVVWLASTFDNPVYLDVALVYGALSFVGVVTLARALEGRGQ